MTDPASGFGLCIPTMSGASTLSKLERSTFVTSNSRLRSGAGRRRRRWCRAFFLKPPSIFARSCPPSSQIEIAAAALQLKTGPRARAPTFGQPLIATEPLALLKWPSSTLCSESNPNIVEAKSISIRFAIKLWRLEVPLKLLLPGWVAGATLPWCGA